MLRVSPPTSQPPPVHHDHKDHPAYLPIYTPSSSPSNYISGIRMEAAIWWAHSSWFRSHSHSQPQHVDLGILGSFKVGTEGAGLGAGIGGVVRLGCVLGAGSGSKASGRLPRLDGWELTLRPGRPTLPNCFNCWPPLKTRTTNYYRSLLVKKTTAFVKLRSICKFGHYP